MRIKQLLILMLLVAVLPAMSFKTSPDVKLKAHTFHAPDGYYLYYSVYSKKPANGKSTCYLSTIVRVCDYENRYGNAAVEVKNRFQKKFINQIMHSYDEEVFATDIKTSYVAVHQEYEDFEKDWLKEKRDPKYNVALVILKW